MPGDPQARKLFFEALELIGRKGPIVAQKVGVPPGEGGDRLEDLITVSQKILMEK